MIAAAAIARRLELGGVEGVGAMAQDQQHATLGVISFGLAVGLTWAILVFVLGLLAALLGWGVVIAAALSSLYIGYGPTFVGSIAGAVWAFVNGLLAGVLIAWFYNRFLVTRRHAMR
jgi:hypothetical protein